MGDTWRKAAPHGANMTDPHLEKLLVSLRSSAAREQRSVEELVSAFFLKSKPHETLGEYLHRSSI